MRSGIIVVLALLIVGVVSGEDEFLAGLEPEDIMKVEVQPDDVSDKGMAETITEAGGKA